MSAIYAAILLLMLLAFLAGFMVAQEHLSSERRNLEYQQAALDAEWRALENSRRVRAVFLNARRAMQMEAQLLSRGGQPWRFPTDRSDLEASG